MTAARHAGARMQADVPLQGDLVSRLTAGEVVTAPLSLTGAPGQPEEAVLAVQLMLLNTGRGCVAGTPPPAAPRPRRTPPGCV